MKLLFLRFSAKSLALGILLAILGRAASAQTDEKLLKKIEKLDARLVKAFEQLAKQYDEFKDPEAAHFLAECAISYGSQDEKVKSIRTSWETLVFIGKFRGGVVTQDTAPIVTGLGNLDSEYFKIVDLLVAQAKKQGISEEMKKILHECAVKHELARGAHEYIQATQRFNALRKAMGLRGILWEFESSSKYISAAWYMAQTGDTGGEPNLEEAHFKSVYLTPSVELAERHTSRLVGEALRDQPEHLRSSVHVRADLLNPNARRIHLACWIGGRVFNPITLYAIPQLPYRTDIPTPEKRYSDETVVSGWEGWVDTEDTLKVNGKRIAYSRYPYDGEPDAPPAYTKIGETGWALGEGKYLATAGIPIMIRFYTTGSTSEVQYDLSDKDGNSYPCRLYQDSDPRLVNPAPWPTILLLPEKPLRARTQFTVRVRCKVNEDAFDKAWKFTTKTE